MKGNSIISISEIKSLLIPLLLLAGLLLPACVPQQVDPMSLPIMKNDLEEAENPPTAEELAVTPHLLLPFLVYKDDATTKLRLEAVMKFIQNAFRDYGNFLSVPQKKVAELLALEENKLFQSSNVADAIHLGKSLKASFVAQFQVFISESETIENIDTFKSKTNLTIFTTDSGQVVFKQDIVFDTQKIEQSEKTLRKVIQENFPLRGFILETRGGKQYAKISLGRSMGIKQGRRFQVRDRIVKKEILLGVARKTVSFAPLALATVSVVQVMEDEAWVEIDKNDRDKIKKGQVVFSLVEKNNIYL